MIKNDFFNLLAEIFVDKEMICASDVLCLADKLLYKELKEMVQNNGGEILYKQEERPVVLARCFEEIVEIEVVAITIDKNSLKLEGKAKNDGASYLLFQDDLCPGEFRHLI